MSNLPADFPTEKLRVDPTSPAPLAFQLSQQIRLLLANEGIAREYRLPSLRDLAGQLGISHHTVRAAYRQLEEEGLLSTRRGVGSVARASDLYSRARRAESGPNFSLGLIIPSFAEYFSPMIRGIQKAAQGDPSLFFICDAQEDPLRVEHYLDRLIARGVDGILLISREVEDFDRIHKIQARPDAFPPIVFADIPGYPPPRVLFDLEGGAHAAAAHLLEHGHRRVGLIIPPRRWRNVAECYRGVQRAFEEAGRRLAAELIVEVADYSLRSGVQAAGQLLQLEQPPTALLALGDLLATGALNSAHERGLSVPEDLALMAYNDPAFFTMIQPSMSTIRVPAYEMGQQAYRLLRQAIDRMPDIPEEVTLATELVIRRSCGCNAQP